MKMLMEIDPPPMRGSLVMTMAMSSPSRREVSLAEQLRWSPRLVSPRGGGVSSRKLASDFFPGKRLHIAEDGHQNVLIPSPVFFINSKIDFHGVSGLLELRRIGLLYLLLFQPRIPAVGILPLYVNLVK